jgi:hypothetical protein
MDEDHDHGFQVVTLIKSLKALSEPVQESKSKVKTVPGCRHGGLEDRPQAPCDACYMTRLRAEDRFGLWVPVQPAKPAQLLAV